MRISISLCLIKILTLEFLLETDGKKKKEEKTDEETPAA
jgi:hypothetical protein